MTSRSEETPVGLILGIGVVIGLGVVGGLLTPHLGFSAYYLYVPLGAAWAAWDSHDLKMKRFERIFPLEPRALFFAVLLAWPVALPWYLYLREKAIWNQLKEPEHPGRAKVIALTGVGVVLAGIYVMGFMILRSPLGQATRTLYRSLQDSSTAQLNVLVTTSGVARIVIIDSPLPAAEPERRRNEAHRLASLAARSAPSGAGLKSIQIRFAESTGGNQPAVPSEEFDWPVDALRGGDSVVVQHMSPGTVR